MQNSVQIKIRWKPRISSFREKLTYGFSTFSARIRHISAELAKISKETVIYEIEKSVLKQEGRKWWTLLGLNQ